LLYALAYMTTPNIFQAPVHIFFVFVFAILFVHAVLEGKIDRYFNLHLKDERTKTLLSRLGILTIIFTLSFVLLLIYKISFS
jgi:hypothetical protein